MLEFGRQAARLSAPGGTVAGVLTWGGFAAARPDLAGFGRRLLYAEGIGLGFLATTRPDGGPRVHPVCPLLTDSGLFGFLVPGPKLADLRRDGRYALHSETFPPPRQDDAFYLYGSVVERGGGELREILTAQLLAERGIDRPWTGFDGEVLIEFLVSGCLLTLTDADDGLRRGHTVWRA